MDEILDLIESVSEGFPTDTQYRVRPHTFDSPFTDSRRAIVSYRGKYVHEVPVNHLGGLSLSKKSVVR